MAREKKNDSDVKQVKDVEAGAGQKQETKAPARRSDTVCVALNRPYGMKFKLPGGRKIVLKGNGESLIGKEKGVLLIGASGYTVIDRADWEQIKKLYGNHPVFKNGLCFATETKSDSMQEAESRDNLRNGLEPVDTEKTATKAHTAGAD